MADQHLHPITVDGLQLRQDIETPFLILRDDGERMLEIPIGLCEGKAIQLALDGETAGRPLTHDLTLILAERFDANPLRLIIDDYSGGTYFARLILKTGEGEISLDCRPSDGVALALRAKIPILASDGVMSAEQHEA